MMLWQRYAFMLVIIEHLQVKQCHILGLQQLQSSCQQGIMRRQQVKRVHHSQFELFIGQFIGKFGTFQLLFARYVLCL